LSARKHLQKRTPRDRQLGKVALFAAVVLCHSGAAHAAAVESGLMGLDPVLSEASSNHGLLVIESDSISGEAGPFAIAATCIDDSILDGPGADCFHEFDGIVGVPFPPDDVTSSLDAHHNQTLFAIPTDSAAPEIAVAERAFDSFRNSLSDASGSQIDTLAAADDGDASSVITGDFRIEDAVPALAVVALSWRVCCCSGLCAATAAPPSSVASSEMSAETGSLIAPGRNNRFEAPLPAEGNTKALGRGVCSHNIISKNLIRHVKIDQQPYKPNK
jgi:hypothetical protein